MSTKKYTTELDLTVTSQAAALNNLNAGADAFTVTSNKVAAFKAAGHNDADWPFWNKTHDDSLNNYRTLATRKSAAGQAAFQIDQNAAKAAAQVSAATTPATAAGAVPATTPIAPAPTSSK